MSQQQDPQQGAPVINVVADTSANTTEGSPPPAPVSPTGSTSSTLVGSESGSGTGDTESLGGSTRAGSPATSEGGAPAEADGGCAGKVETVRYG